MEETFPTSEAGASLGDHSIEVPACTACGAKEGKTHRLTWQMSRLDIELTDDVSINEWMERRQGLPSILVLPDGDGVLAYSVEPYCDDCLDRQWREYEERHTPADKMSRATFLEQIRTYSLGAGWVPYTLQLQYLSPRGFPNLALIRNNQLLFRSVRGDVHARPRAFRPSGQCLIMSPEVPQSTREALTMDPNEGLLSQKVAFLYMDEKYPDYKSPPSMQVTSLTGLLIGSDQFISFRDAFFRILPGFDQGAEHFPVEIHAGDLFRGRPDEEHSRFYSGLVSLVNDFKCSVYRRGFNFVAGHELLRKKQKDLLGLCFRSILISVEDFEHFGQIWPVMETDGSKEQDENFAGFKRWMDEATAYLNWSGDGVGALIDDDIMVDSSRFGDLHYVTKKSIGGIAVDCLAYLLHCKWLDENGFPTTAYKTRLASIATALSPAIVDDYVGSFRIDSQPEGFNSPPSELEKT